jgi:hypothetical protein
MARAIIHNSDYASPEAARGAIDRYFAERNEYYLRNPRRAGDKVWGKERVPATFSEDQNCKDPEYRCVRIGPQIPLFPAAARRPTYPSGISHYRPVRARVFGG